MRANELRQKYLDFFKSKGHLQLPRASLIPSDVLGTPDNSTLFTGSGMQQFKPYFIGAATPPSRRVTTVQTCLRTGDIDSVGDYSHCTMFEMLGNFSFGDYFKSEVIPWTWEFLTEWVGLDPDRLHVTVFLDDDEAFDIWHNVIGLPKDRIHRLGEDKNYWPANAISEGPNGPCGPCSEIYYRVAPLEEMASDPAFSPTERFILDDDAGRYVEIWNNVFTQFDRSEDEHGKPVLTPLPQKNNDTGAGFDRIAFVSQGKTSVFETDIFLPTLQEIEHLSGKTYTGTMEPEDFAFRVVAEHTRSMVFCIADGILPEKTGRGYVLRYIMRRAIRYGAFVLGFTEPFLHRIAPKVIEQMGDFYTELKERRELILRTIQAEEESFRRTLDNGMRRLETMLESASVRQSGVLPGADVFMLYDTYGFPHQLTQDIAAERGFQVDLEGFERAMEKQRELSQQGSNIERDVFGNFEAALAQLQKTLPPTEFLGYAQTSAEAKILGMVQRGELIETARPGDEVTLVLDRTPFYAQSGGQVGDTGEITAPAGNTTCALRIEVTDTQKSGGLWLHSAKVLEGEASVGQSVQASVYPQRSDIKRNHTATHLLQAALQQVLGAHVHQKGSEVRADGLRFDFTHSQPVTLEELQQVERIVNEQVLADKNVTVYTDLPLSEAKAMGAMALFGEKYGDRVRMIEIPDFSRELCGGTHLEHTSQVGLFKITRETGIAAGVRRIEAVTGTGAYRYTLAQEEKLAHVASLLKSNPHDVVGAAERLLAQRQELERQNRQLKAGGGAAAAAELTPQDVNGVPVVAQRLDDADAETLSNLTDRTAQKLGSAVIVLGSVNEGKVAFAAKVTKDLLDRGLHAGNLVREVAKIAGGGGGGRPDFAQAGGRDPGKLQEALDAVPRLVEAQLAK